MTVRCAGWEGTGTSPVCRLRRNWNQSGVQVEKELEQVRCAGWEGTGTSPVCRLIRNWNQFVVQVEKELEPVRCAGWEGIGTSPVCRLRRIWNHAGVQVEKELEPVPSQPAPRTITYREYYTRFCINTIWPPDDEHRVARNMQRIIIIKNVLYNVIVHPVGHLPSVLNESVLYISWK